MLRDDYSVLIGSRSFRVALLAAVVTVGLIFVGGFLSANLLLEATAPLPAIAEEVVVENLDTVPSSASRLEPSVDDSLAIRVGQAGSEGPPPQEPLEEPVAAAQATVELRPVLPVLTAPRSVRRPPRFQFHRDELSRPELSELIREAAGLNQVDPLLVAAIIQVESNFNPAARSRQGAVGLMQVLPSTGRRYGVSERELMNPTANLRAGTRHLSYLVGRFGNDLDLVLAAYNAGEGAVERYYGVPPFPETRDYLKRVRAALATMSVPGSIDAVD